MVCLRFRILPLLPWTERRPGTPMSNVAGLGRRHTVHIPHTHTHTQCLAPPRPVSRLHPTLVAAVRRFARARRSESRPALSLRLRPVQAVRLASVQRWPRPSAKTRPSASRPAVSARPSSRTTFLTPLVRVFRSVRVGERPPPKAHRWVLPSVALLGRVGFAAWLASRAQTTNCAAQARCASYFASTAR